MNLIHDDRSPFFAPIQSFLYIFFHLPICQTASQDGPTDPSGDLFTQFIFIFTAFPYSAKDETQNMDNDGQTWLILNSARAWY